MELTFDHVTKFYGPVIGVNDISCRLGAGVTGLFGANGAGKSTLIKLAAGQLLPSLGRVEVGENAAWSPAAKRSLGYSPDINSFYEEMTGREFVFTLARLSGFSRGDARSRTEQALEHVGMSDRAHRRLAGCSHGMRQRIKLAQSLVHDPSVLLLDEPHAGIDPGGRREINDLLVRLAEEGRTIIVSTHILVEVEKLADSILMIARGRIIASGTLREIRALLDSQPLTVEIEAPEARRLASCLLQTSEVSSVEIRGDKLTVRTHQPDRFFAAVGDLVVQHGLEINRLVTLDAGADAVFNYLQQGAP